MISRTRMLLMVSCHTVQKSPDGGVHTCVMYHTCMSVIAGRPGEGPSPESLTPDGQD